jgi:uncharacterized damage-inducible protein DinB
MAEYNSWANARIFRAAAQLSDEQYRRDVGAYFKSLHGTLNHLLTADRMWMHRLTGTGDQPTSLNGILFDDLPSLSVARRSEDERIASFVQELDDARIEGFCEYRTLNGAAQKMSVSEILAHLFNHQTHHRGQAHAILTTLGIQEPEPMDLLIMLRQRRQGQAT